MIGDCFFKTADEEA